MEIILAVVGSNALFAFITFLIQRMDKKKEGKDTTAEEVKKLQKDVTELTKSVNSISETTKKQSDMLIGLGHDRICFLGNQYIKNGSMSQSDYENIYNSLYLPYKALGGNGTAKKIVEEVDKLPIK